MIRNYFSLISALQVPARGQVFLSNFIFDSRNKRLPIDVMRYFWQGAAREWVTNGKLSKPEVFIEEYSKRSAKLSFAAVFCQGTKISVDREKCSRVIEAQDIITYKNIDLSKIGYNINGYISQKQITQLQNFGLTGIAQGEMSSARLFIWVTRSKEISDLRSTYSRRTIANAVRDKLGLLHFDEDQQLIEIVFPEGILHELRVPTFIEGNPSLVYRSCVSRDGWGKACDLTDYGEGLSEAVHPSTEFNDTFEIKYIGQIRPPKPAFDWEKFLDTLVFKWKFIMLGEFRKYV